MSDTRLNIARLVELCGAVCDDAISDADAAALDAMLAGDSEARRIYGLVIDTHLDLEAMRDAAMEAVVEPAGRIGTGRSPRLMRAAVIGVAGALVALLALMIATQGDRLGPPGPWPQPIVATVVETGGALVVGDDLVTAGQDLSAGPIHLAAGEGELMLVGGTHVTLRGPVEGHLDASGSMTIKRGRAAFYCPPAARGFTVALPGGARIIDLGTAFTVAADEHRGALVSVGEGAVLVRSSDGGEARLNAGDAGTIDPLGTFTPFDRPVRIVHYAFDEPDGDRAIDSGVGFTDEPRDAQIIDGGRSGGARRIEGVVGGAIELDGVHLLSAFEGIGGGSERTVAFWLRLPTGADAKHAQAIVSWGDLSTPGGGWQIGWDYFSKDHLGAIRLVVGPHGVVTGDRDLRDGRWHHVAVVLEAADPPQVQRDVRLYVDGEIAAVGRATASMIDTRTGRGANPLRIGWDLRTGRAAFRGAIDELYVFDTALSIEQVVALMRRGLPEPGATHSPGADPFQSRTKEQDR